MDFCHVLWQHEFHTLFHLGNTDYMIHIVLVIYLKENLIYMKPLIHFQLR